MSDAMRTDLGFILSDTNISNTYIKLHTITLQNRRFSSQSAAHGELQTAGQLPLQTGNYHDMVQP